MRDPSRGAEIAEPARKYAPSHCMVCRAVVSHGQARSRHGYAGAHPDGRLIVGHIPLPVVLIQEEWTVTVRPSRTRRHEPVVPDGR